MDNASARAQLLEHFLSFFMPEGILDFLRIASHATLQVSPKNLLLEEYPLAEKGLTGDGDTWLWEGDVNGMNGVGRFVLGLPRHIEVLEGDELREFLRENAEFILKK